MRGIPSKIPPQGIIIALYTALFLVLVARERSKTSVLLHGAMFVGMLAFSLDDLNRTTLAFLALGAVGATLLRIRIDKVGTMAFASVLSLTPVALPAIIPDGSKTEARLLALVDTEAREESVSLISRDLEAQQISAALKDAGPVAQLIGLGHGAGYQFRIPGKFEEDHGHAHYAFAFFELRYGKIGLLYVVIIGIFLTLSMYYGLRSGGPIAYFGALMSLACLLYLFTYVNFFMYQVALPFVCLLRPVRGPSRPSDLSGDYASQGGGIRSVRAF
jgi:hypothetical protein